MNIEWNKSTNFFRYEEVLRYLEQVKATDAVWVAVDDNAENYPFGTNIVVTNPYEGFDDVAAWQLDSFLKSLRI